MRWQTITISHMHVWAGDYEKFIFIEIRWAIWTIVRRRVEQLIKAMADNGAGGAEMPINGQRLARRTSNLRRAGGNRDDGKLMKGCGGRCRDGSYSCRLTRGVWDERELRVPSLGKMRHTYTSSSVLKISRKCHEHDGVWLLRANAEAVEAMEWAQPGRGGQRYSMEDSRDKRSKLKSRAGKLHYQGKINRPPSSKDKLLKGNGDSNWWRTPLTYTVLWKVLSASLAGWSHLSLRLISMVNQEGVIIELQKSGFVGD
ncbi:hypothetical protein PILCRDRAFT_802937 [Piloderma croceum F 1598]|uniref:Uncharacterized protein n=1 Tax=Piloderma croceum (strain F 1598) TaxID=765440 RepID=A0A0C3B7G2_PILCF|nr:hypothetical protein PILCRDRAFT_802937 [Piloderma croceum F 1598]